MPDTPPCAGRVSAVKARVLEHLAELVTDLMRVRLERASAEHQRTRGVALPTSS